MWQKIEAEGCEWEVRPVTSETEASGAEIAEAQEVLEFRTSAANRPPRRAAVPAGSLEDMDEDALRAAFARARPIGGDHYGRPGKVMTDLREE